MTLAKRETPKNESICSKIGDEDFWNDLLDFIECEKVLPIVGWNVTTISDGNRLLEPWLAQRLAERLRIDPTDLPADPNLNDVVCRHLVSGGAREVIYTRLHRVLRDDCPQAGETLRRLASIDGLRHFLTTTFDPLLENVLNEVRHNGEPLTRVHAYSPHAESKDLPAHAEPR